MKKGSKQKPEVILKLREIALKKGIRPPSRKGLPTSELQKKRARETHTGVNNVNYGKRPSDEQIKKLVEMSSKRKGSKNNLWRGGVTPVNQLIRSSSKMKTWRVSVFERDGYTCLFCGQVGCRLNADHVIPFSSIIKQIIFEGGMSLVYENSMNNLLLWDINNGRTLCENCHRKTDTFGEKAKTYVK